MAICNEKSRKVVQDQITKCVLIINKYNWLHNTLLHDFFIEDHWNKLPSGWRSSLIKLSPAELANFLNYWDVDCFKSSNSKNILLPLELIALKCCVKQLSLNRNPVQNIYEAIKDISTISSESKPLGTGMYLTNFRTFYKREMKLA